MAEYYLIALVALLAVVIVRGLAAPVRFYEYPYFMSAVFAAFIVPQAISLVRFPLGARPHMIEAVLLMTLLCVLACLAGYRAPASRWIVEKTQVPLDDRRLFRWGIAFIVCAFVFTYLISRMSFEERGGNLWTGRVTIYGFFANLAYPGFAICLNRALARRDQAAWFWTAVGSMIPLVSAIFYARREPAVMFALTIALTLYYQRRFVPPRAVVAAGLIGVMLFIPATGKYRGVVGEGGLSDVTRIQFVNIFQSFLQGASVLELRNAAMMIEATAQTNRYNFGSGYWDQLVFRFVPGQIIGHDLKKSLMFKSSDERLREEFADMGYKVEPGSTMTGIGDAFKEFGYFGALFFAVLAVVFKSLWHASLQPNSVFAQLLYIQTATSAMRAVTHQTVDYLPGLVYNLIFIGLAVYYSRAERPAERAGPMARRAI